MPAKKDLLGAAKKKATVAKPATSKTEIRQIVVTDPTIVSLIEIASLTGDLKPLQEQHAETVQGVLFDIWSEEMWRDKRKPDNFKAVVKKGSMDDARCNFILKINSRGLQKAVPAEADLPEDKTVQEVLVEMIAAQCGLTQKNAKAFVNKEVDVIDQIDLAQSFDKMYGSEGVQHRIAELLLEYMQARPESGDTVTLPAFTDDLEGAALVTKQIVTLKDGVENRIFTYCDSLDQLRALLTFCNVTKQVSNFEYAVSDTKQAKHERQQAAVKKYLVPA